MKAASGCVFVFAMGFGLTFYIKICDAQNKENVALNKPCKMSSKFYDSEPAGFAVNGKTNKDLPSSGCAHTDFNDYNPWWEVDLGRRYVISSITVWARTNFVNRMGNTIILVDGQLCFSFNRSYTSNQDTQFNILCTTSLVGQTVRLVRNSMGIRNGDEPLNVCEVQVFGCKDRFWGDECNQCGHCLDAEVCDKVEGHCTNCSAGFMLSTCVRECADKTYGINCALNCSGRCQNICNKSTGNCLSCSPGWMAPTCESACSDRSYGLNCTSNCSAGCSNICAKEDGYCNCTSEWAGKKCDIRKDQLQINQPHIAVIGGAVGGGVGLIIIVAVIVVCVVSWLKRRSQPLAKGSAAAAADTELTPSHHQGFSAAHEVTTPTARHQEHVTSQPRKRQHINHSHTTLISGAQVSSPQPHQQHPQPRSSPLTASETAATTAEEAEAGADGPYENVTGVAEAEFTKNYDSLAIYQNKDVNLYAQLEK